MNQAFHIWFYCVTSECAMLHSTASCHTVLHHVAYAYICCCGYWVYEWVILHMNESFYMWTSHFTYECAILHMNASCDVWVVLLIGAPHCTVLRHIAYECSICCRVYWVDARGILRWIQCVTYEYVLSRMNPLCYMWMRCVTQYCVTPRFFKCSICCCVCWVYAWLMLHINSLCYLSMSRVNGLCYMWMCHVTQYCVISRMNAASAVASAERVNESCHVWMRCVMYECITSRIRCVTYECVMWHSTASYRVWMQHPLLRLLGV